MGFERFMVRAMFGIAAISAGIATRLFFQGEGIMGTKFLGHFLMFVSLGLLWHVRVED